MEELKQRGLAADYAAKFRQLALRLEWHDEPLMTAFYKGLKEEVKDELFKEDMLETLSEYVAMAVRIDNRQYQQCMQKKGRDNWTLTPRKFRTYYHAN